MKADEKLVHAAQADGKLASALEALRKYHARQNRAEHPEGHSDNGGRWYPKGRDADVLDDSVRSPSRAWPWSYMQACRSLSHCERLCGADHAMVLAVRRVLKRAGLDESQPEHLRAWLDARVLAEQLAAPRCRRRA